MYQERIKNLLAEKGRKDIDPRHVEAFMRIEHGTLDHLSASTFQYETCLAVRHIEATGETQWERIAKGVFGL